MKKTIKNQSKGITLIALIITIIILLILAGVTIATLTGENGLLSNANKAVGEYSEAQAKEEVELAIADLTMAYYQGDNVQANETLSAYLQRKLNGYTTSSGATITCDADGKIAYTKDGVSTNMTMDANGKVTVDGTSETPVTPPTPTPPEEIPAASITEAQTNDMYDKTVNSELTDDYGNKIVVPAGFKILSDSTTNNATTVDKGIVVVDSNGNEFVWIPVPADGKVYTNTEKTAYKTVKLSRYTFADDGTPIEQGDAAIVDYDDDNFQELQTPPNGNTPAKSITNFKTSVTTNGGYYIGRYEARTGTERTEETDDTGLTQITSKGSDYVYNYVTQIQAANLARNMYDNTKPFTSDLMNSYAWDTATLFLQECGTNSTYSRQSSLNTGSLAKKGTNDTTEYAGTADVQCNVYDMASNTWEWTTETYSNAYGPCTYRGGFCNDSIYYTSVRDNNSMTYCDVGSSFRPLLYL